MLLGQVAVLVPAAEEDLREPHAALGQPAGEQAVVGERAGLLHLRAVQVEHALRLLARCRSAPAPTSACGRPSRTGRCGRRSRGRPALRAACWFSSARPSSILRRRVADRRPAGWRGTAPGRRPSAARRPGACVGRKPAPHSRENRACGCDAGGQPRVQHDERRQVLVRAAEAVAEPGAHARPAGNLAAGLNVGDRRVVVDRLGVHRLDRWHRSSTIAARCGSSSLTHVPFWPCWANLNIDGATGSRAWPRVIVVSRWPLRTDVGQVLVEELVPASACSRTGRAATGRRP